MTFFLLTSNFFLVCLHEIVTDRAVVYYKEYFNRVNNERRTFWFVRICSMTRLSVITVHCLNWVIQSVLHSKTGGVFREFLTKSKRVWTLDVFSEMKEKKERKKEKKKIRSVFIRSGLSSSQRCTQQRLHILSLHEVPMALLSPCRQGQVTRVRDIWKRLESL